MKRFLIGALLALGLLCPGPARSASMLTDAELVGVSGGGIDPHLGGQSLPQDQQQPGSNSSGHTPPQQLQMNDGMDLAPEVFAVLQSRVDVRRDRKVLLGGTTQQNALALNLDNLLSSDSIATNNIFEGSSLSRGDVTAEVEINQVNSLDQHHRTQGSLTSSIAGLRYETTVESRSGSDKYERYAFSQVKRQRGSEIERTESTNAHVRVGGRVASFDDLAAGVPPIQLTKPRGPVLPFKLGEKFCTDLGCVGVGLWYSGLNVTETSLNLDRLATQGNDLVLSTSLTLPTLDLGEGQACFGICTKEIKFGSISGGTIPQEFNFPGLGPRIDALNLGSGFAMVGTGTVNIGKPDVSISGDVGIKVTPWLNLTLDLTKAGFFGDAANKLLGKNFFPEELKFDLINLHVPFTLVKPNPVSLAGRIDGSIFYSDNGTGDTNHSTTDNLNQDNNTTQESIKIDVAESSFSESYEHTVFSGGRMTGAEAELLALSEGALSINNNSNVTLTDGAQQNMRVMNGVNASSSVAANALNMSRLAAFRAGPSSGSRTIMTQQNRFNQQK